ncbi:PAS domain S-box protein [Myxococcota bacterium]|nr:PAS domain S-box protein [Myxococcota bacterium]
MELLSTLFRSKLAVLLLIDPTNGAIVDANESAARFYGYSREELLKKSISEINTLPVAEVRALMQRTDSGERQYFEFQHRLASGAVRDVAVYSDPIELDGRRLLFSLIHDITEHVRAREARERADARLTAIFAGSRDGLLVGDPDTGLLLDANPAACVMLGRRREELVGLHHSAIYTPESMARARENYLVRARGDGVGPVEYEALHASGARVPIEVNASLVTLPGGQRVLFGVFRDISERKAAERQRAALEEELRQAQKMEAIGQLAGGIAHDFNNMLAAQLLEVEMLIERRDLPSDVRDALGSISAGARHAADLTRQLLAFGRRQVMKPEALELNGLLASFSKMLRRIVDERIELTLAPSPEPLWIRGDRGMVEQVLMNLVVNARDAIHGPGRITITTGHRWSAEHDHDYACFSVEDTGAGMDEATKARIFEPFFTTKDPSRGTGLGLATVYGIVRQHSGKIDVHTEVGGGTTFDVLWPLTEPATPRASRATSRPAAGVGQLVLLVEDESAVRRTLRRALEHLGHRVLEAEDGRRALEVWAEHAAEISMLITDMVMPGALNGLELAQRLRAERPTLDVIVASGYSDALATRGAPEGSGIVFLGKPIGLAALAAQLDTFSTQRARATPSARAP